MSRNRFITRGRALALRGGISGHGRVQDRHGINWGTYIRSAVTLPRSWLPRQTSIRGLAVTAGSAENVQRLRYEPGVKFAIVQSDVYQAFLDLAAAGTPKLAPDPPASRIVPLYNEEIYFVVRADSN